MVELQVLGLHADRRRGEERILNVSLECTEVSPACLSLLFLRALSLARPELLGLGLLTVAKGEGDVAVQRSLELLLHDLGLAILGFQRPRQQPSTRDICQGCPPLCPSWYFRTTVGCCCSR